MRKKASEKCNDENCPIHGSLSTRGRILTGIVISTKMQRTAIIEWERRLYVSKYERFEKRRSRVKAHNPNCINAKDGDLVKIMECKPLSKTKNFAIIEVIGKEKRFKEKMEARQEAKVEAKKKEPKVELNKTEEEKDAANKGEKD